MPEYGGEHHQKSECCRDHESCVFHNRLRELCSANFLAALTLRRPRKTFNALDVICMLSPAKGKRGPTPPLIRSQLFLKAPRLPQPALPGTRYGPPNKNDQKWRQRLRIASWVPRREIDFDTRRGRRRVTQFKLAGYVSKESYRRTREPLYLSRGHLADSRLLHRPTGWRSRSSSALFASQSLRLAG